MAYASAFSFSDCTRVPSRSNMMARIIALLAYHKTRWRSCLPNNTAYFRWFNPVVIRPWDSSPLLLHSGS